MFLMLPPAATTCYRARGRVDLRTHALIIQTDPSNLKPAFVTCAFFLQIFSLGGMGEFIHNVRFPGRRM